MIVVYKDMKSNIFSKKGYGTYETMESVKKALTSSVKIYDPILNCSKKAELIRTQLSFIDRYRFFFTLPSTLKEALKKVCIYFTIETSLYEILLIGSKASVSLFVIIRGVNPF